jgi:hypothetical protein
MRHLIFLFATLGLTQQSFAAWSLVNHSSAGAATSGASSVTAGSVNMTGADTIFVSVTIYNQNPNGSCTVTDSVGTNVWHLAGSEYIGGIEANVALFYAYNAHVNSAMTATVTCGASTYAGMTFWGFSGGLKASDPRDSGSVNGDIVNAGQTHYQPGSATAASGELTITVIGVGGASAAVVSIDSLFTVIDSVNYVSGNSEANGAAYLVSAGTALDPAWTILPGNSASSVIASFKPITALSGSAPTPAPAVIF